MDVFSIIVAYKFGVFLLYPLIPLIHLSQKLASALPVTGAWRLRQRHRRSRQLYFPCIVQIFGLDYLRTRIWVSGWCLFRGARVGSWSPWRLGGLWFRSASGVDCWLIIELSLQTFHFFGVVMRLVLLCFSGGVAFVCCVSHPGWCFVLASVSIWFGQCSFRCRFTWVVN